MFYCWNWSWFRNWICRNECCSCNQSLITFLDIPAYEAVGIALASDVLASAISAYTYGKNKNLDIKNGIVMMITVLCFTMVGSWISSLVPSNTMGGLFCIYDLIIRN